MCDPLAERDRGPLALPTGPRPYLPTKYRERTTVFGRSDDALANATHRSRVGRTRRGDPLAEPPRDRVDSFRAGHRDFAQETHATVPGVTRGAFHPFDECRSRSLVGRDRVCDDLAECGRRRCQLRSGCLSHALHQRRGRVCGQVGVQRDASSDRTSEPTPLPVAERGIFTEPPERLKRLFPGTIR
ncbi:hypothetical protein C496_23296 [Natronorubrum tibetense GA33]|uniref:Uncharacterized protein n=1 Tax=Natronorubrum tibetense GA33 TaxID=1114856 RepID=L9VES2_9EURY|nr:hypothetical protein C496_23296 [Natronorubrum tibetense GA33]